MASGFGGRAGMGAGPDLGVKVKEKHATELLNVLARILAPGERVLLLVTTDLQAPKLTHLAITDSRVFGIDRGQLARTGPAWAVMLADVATADIAGPGTPVPNALLAQLRNGSQVTFGSVEARDVEFLMLTMSVAGGVQVPRFDAQEAAPPPGARFATPPGWPVSPPGWVPPPGWQPDPSWPPPPPGWQFWVVDPQQPVVAQSWSGTGPQPVVSGTGPQPVVAQSGVAAPVAQPAAQPWEAAAQWEAGPQPGIGAGDAVQAQVDAADVVRAFWAGLEAREWDEVGELLAEDLVVEQPATGERTEGRDAYLGAYSEQPGARSIEVLRIVGEGTEVASEVEITDGAEAFRLASFWTVRNERITTITEYPATKPH
jgi:ketosteroid isomerase-like protein